MQIITKSFATLAMVCEQHFSEYGQSLGTRNEVTEGERAALFSPF